MVNYIFLLIGVFLLILGILMYKGLLVDAIAGFDSKKDNKVAAGKWVGSNLLIMGLLVALSSIITLIVKVESPLVIFCMSMGSVIILSLRCALLYNKKIKS